jgi:hypothetical protein
MGLSIKKAVLWRRELENRPGSLSESLKPFAEAGVTLQVVMGYTFPGKPDLAAVEVYPVTGNRAETAALAGGLAPAEGINCLVVEGDDRPGLAYEMTDAISRAGINLNFGMFQVVGRRFVAVFGFDKQADVDKAAQYIREAEEER